MPRVTTIAASVAFVFGAACTSGTDARSSPTSGPERSSSTSSTSATSATSTTRPSVTVTVATAPPTTALVAAPTTSVLDLASSAGIATELTRVEQTIRTVVVDTADADQAGREQQRAFRALAGHPEWDDAVIATVDPAVRAAVELTIEARQAVAAHSATRAPTEPPLTLPAWTIRAPLPVAGLLELYREGEALTGVPWAHLAAINFVETRFGRIGGASPDGARGPMQFLPSTWAECCTGDIEDPRDAIIGAATYLRSNGAPADMAAALYAYNPNAGYVGAVDAYARNMAADERAIVGYHGWEVYVTSSAGTVRLPVGYSATDPVDAADYVAAHPDDLAG